MLDLLFPFTKVLFLFCFVLFCFVLFIYLFIVFPGSPLVRCPYCTAPYSPNFKVKWVKTNNQTNKTNKHTKEIEKTDFSLFFFLFFFFFFLLGQSLFNLWSCRGGKRLPRLFLGKIRPTTRIKLNVFSLLFFIGSEKNYSQYISNFNLKTISPKIIYPNSQFLSHFP